MSRMFVTRCGLLAILVSTTVVLAWPGPAVEPIAAQKPPQTKTAKATPHLPDGVIPLWELSASKKTTQELDDATERNLQAVVDVDIKNQKLRDVLKTLSQDGKRFRVIVDDSSLDRGAVLAQRVTLRSKGFPIERILQRALDSLGVEWIICDGIVQVTANDSVERFTRIYSLAGIESPEASSQLRLAATRTPTGRADRSSFPGTEYDWILDTIQSHTRGTWKPTDNMGGTMQVVNATLIVDQTFHAHREISELLRVLRLAAGGKLHGGAFNLRHRNYPYRWDAHIRRQLAKPSTLQLKDVPLNMALREIARTLDVTFWEYSGLLKGARDSLDEKVSIDARGLTWEAALKKLFSAAGTEYFIDEGTIRILPEGGCEGPTSSYLFDVRDLMKAGFAQDRIEDIIQNQTSGIWQADGDPNGGSLSVNSDFGVVLVNQTRGVIREIAQLLQGLRGHLAKSRKSGGDKLVSSKYLDRVEIRYYEVDNRAKAKELAAAIPVFVEPAAWKAARFIPAIKVVDGTLIVRQSVRVHRSIQRFLRELEPEPMPNPWQGGLGGLGGGFF